MSEEDAKLVKAARVGDRAAFDVLVKRYQRQAVAVAFRLVGNMEDALDVAQIAFVRAYQALDQLKQANRFGPWLMKIITNNALNYRRHRSRHAAASLTEASSRDNDQAGADLERQLAGKEPSAYERFAASELSQAIQIAIDELPDNLRTALVLFVMEKVPQKEIADIMDCSVQMVKWNVFEARRQLRQRLQGLL